MYKLTIDRIYIFNIFFKVICSSMEDTVMHIILALGLEPSQVKVFVGLDDGQKFNKIGFIIKEVVKKAKSDKLQHSDNIFQNNFKDSSVKKLFWLQLYLGHLKTTTTRRSYLNLWEWRVLSFLYLWT